MQRPLIGITGRRLPLSRLSDVPEILRTAQAELHLWDYARLVDAAGGLPVQLSFATDPAIVERLDGLLLSGGGDVDPRRYQGAGGPTVTDVDPGRDVRELALYAAARQQRRPVLGICRGLQVINVAHGGTLVEDLPEGVGQRHASFDDARDARVVDVVTVPDTRPATWYGASTRVNCLHHQAVDRLGDGLRVAARAIDGVVEAIEVPGEPVAAVQWHPELFAGTDACVAWLVAAAGGRGHANDPDTG